MRRPAIKAGHQPSLLVEPRERALDHPAMATEPFLRLDATARDAAARLATLSEIIAFVGMRLPRTEARPAGTALLQRRDGIQ